MAKSATKTFTAWSGDSLAAIIRASYSGKGCYRTIDLVLDKLKADAESRTDTQPCRKIKITLIAEDV